MNNKTENKIVIAGYGWVGKAVKELFPQSDIYDPQLGYNAELKDYNIVFICVPTPNKENGELDSKYLDNVISQCSKKSLIIIRSTVQPGLSVKWKSYNYRIVSQPEYLGETVAHPLLDETKRNFLIIGGDPEDRRELIELYQTVYNANINIRQVSNYEAEVIKLSENRAIAFKVAQCQELYDVCERANIDYYKIREAVYGDDQRFNLWFSFIYPNERGFNSKCIPKDIYAWSAWAESIGYEPKITNTILSKNKEWINE